MRRNVVAHAPFRACERVAVTEEFPTGFRRFQACFSVEHPRPTALALGFAVFRRYAKVLLSNPC